MKSEEIKQLFAQFEGAASELEGVSILLELLQNIIFALHCPKG